MLASSKPVDIMLISLLFFGMLISRCTKRSWSRWLEIVFFFLRA